MKNALKLQAVFALASSSLLAPMASATVIHFPENTTIANSIEVTAERSAYRDRSCLKLSQFLANPQAYEYAKSHETLTSLYNSSAFSRQMMQRAASRGVVVCDMDLPNNVGGVHIPSQNKVGLDFSRPNSRITNMVYLSHEFAHYIQDINGSDYFDPNRSIYDNQRVLLAMETAAPVAELISSYLAAENGEWRARSPFPRHSVRDRWNRHFRNEVSKGERAGLTQSEAINRAAKRVWPEVFENQRLLDYYNGRVLLYAIGNISLMNPEIAGKPNVTGELEAEIRGAGHLSDKIDFTSLAAMPKGKALFGNNDEMRRMFEAAEWYRQSKIYGADHSYVITRRNYLRATGNPFVDADFEKARQMMLNGKPADEAIKDSLDRFAPKAPARRINFTGLQA